MNIEERESQENIRRVAPTVSQAYKLGKEGRHDEAFAVLRPYMECNEVPTYLCQPAGWAVYRYMKAHLSQLLPAEATIIFGYYLNFCRHEPDMIHSCMMMLAVAYKKLHTQEFSMSDFCRQWGLDNFRDEDCQAKKDTLPDGKPITYQSLAVKVATLLYKELKQRRTADTAAEFLPFFETVLVRCPDYEFTSLYIANLHAWLGEKELAIKQFKDMLASNPQWYVWKHLGDLLDGRRRFSCYCKAMTLCSNDDYLGEIHLTLASQLCVTDPPQAAYELATYTDTYHHNHWSIRPEAYEIGKALKGIAAAVDGKTFYPRHVGEAETFAYADMPEDDFMYVGETANKAGMRRARLSNRTKRISMTVPFSPTLRKATVGDIFRCRYRNDGNRTILLTVHATGKKMQVKRQQTTSQVTHDNTRQTIQEVEGVVRINAEKPFAFVGNYFIPPHLRQSEALYNDQHIRAKASQQQDGRWRVIKVTEKL